VYISLRLEESGLPETLPLQLALEGVSTLLGCIVLAALLRALRGGGRTSPFDGLVTSMIVLTILSGVLSLLSRTVLAWRDTVSLVLLATAMVQGVVAVRFGRLLLRSPRAADRRWWTFGWLSIITGVCLVSVVLIPVALVTGSISDVLLGTIFRGDDRGSPSL